MLREHSRTQNKLKQDLGALFYQRFRMKRFTRFYLILMAFCGSMVIKENANMG